jgi:hypothetical protein
VEVEISPEPTAAEREALLAALRESLGAVEQPAAYASAWRQAALDSDGNGDLSD